MCVNSSIRSDEELSLETSAWKLFTLANLQYISSGDNAKLPCYTLPTTQLHSFFRNLPPLTSFKPYLLILITSKEEFEPILQVEDQGNVLSPPLSPPLLPHGLRTKKSRNKRHFSLDNGVFEVNTSLFRANGWDEKVYVVKLGKCLESNGRWFCLLQKKFGGRLNTIFAQGYENLNKPILRNSNARRGVGGGGGIEVSSNWLTHKVSHFWNTRDVSLSGVIS